MKLISLFSLFFALLILTAPAATVDAVSIYSDDISGKWTLAVEVPGESAEVVLDLKQDGEAVTGTMASTHGSGKLTKGTFKDKKFTATISADIQGSPMDLQLEGKVDGEKISGSLTAPGLGTFPYSGTKTKK